MGTHQKLIDIQIRIAYLIDAFKCIGVVTAAKDEYGHDVLDELQRAVFALAMSLSGVNSWLEDITAELEGAKQ